MARQDQNLPARVSDLEQKTFGQSRASEVVRVRRGRTHRDMCRNHRKPEPEDQRGAGGPSVLSLPGSGRPLGMISATIAAAAGGRDLPAFSIP
jgi:hypothetical protein